MNEQATIKIDPTIDIHFLPPQYKYVLLFDEGDGRWKTGRLLHGLWEQGYYYELEGNEMQDKKKQITHYQLLPAKPVDYQKKQEEQRVKRAEDLLEGL